MHAFEYIRPDDVASAVALVSGDPKAQYLAGGTTQVDLMLKDGVLEPWAVPSRSCAVCVGRGITGIAEAVGVYSREALLGRV